MTHLQKLHEIEAKKTIYDIHYCNAGIGFIFYYSEKDNNKHEASWKGALEIDKYYPTIEEAIDGEYARLIK